MSEEFQESTTEETAVEAVPADDIEIEHRRRSRFSMALLGGLVLAATGGVYFMYSKAGPASASAAESEQAVRTMLDDSAKNVSKMKAQQIELEKTVDQFKRFPAAAQVSIDKLSRDPFHDSDNSAAKPTEQAALRALELQKEQAMLRVQTLKLNSIMFGDKNRSCLINGRFRNEGETFDDFVIHQINADSVIVGHAGLRFLLQVQR